MQSAPPKGAAESEVLVVDPGREAKRHFMSISTGIFVRAKASPSSAKFVNADIYSLDKTSLLTWLKSRGGDNEWAENTVLILLGHFDPTLKSESDA